MGRRVKLTEEQQNAIRASGKYHKDLAEEYGVSALTISRIKHRTGGYKFRESGLGSPVLDAHGRVIGIEQRGETRQGGDEPTSFTTRDTETPGAA